LRSLGCEAYRFSKLAVEIGFGTLIFINFQVAKTSQGLIPPSFFISGAKVQNLDNKKAQIIRFGLLIS
jgi:hypothetical protein